MNTFVENKHLKFLDLNKNVISKINVTWLNNQKLETLDISENKIKMIEQNTFVGLIDLNYLYLNKNNITNINSHGFKGLMKLITINLSQNKITALEDNTFMHLTYLKELYISDNKLHDLRRALNDLEHLLTFHQQSLKNLNLRKIKTIECGSFRFMLNLQSVHLQHNISNRDLSCLFYLNSSEKRFLIEKLNIDYTNLILLSVGSFKNTPYILNLSLQHNMISTIQNGSFKELTRLYSLNISHNCLENINNGIFVGLKSLKVLDISHNQLTVLGNLTNLNSLVFLKLSFNVTTHIHQGIFTTLNVLTYLDLSGNKIHYIDSNAFTLKKTFMRKISLQYNMLIALPWNIFDKRNLSFQERNYRLVSLELKGNNLSNDEKNCWIEHAVEA